MRSITAITVLALGCSGAADLDRGDPGPPSPSAPHAGHKAPESLATQSQPSERAAVGGTVEQAVRPALPVESRHSVFSLLDNRWLAHRLRGGALLLAAGSPGFAKYSGLQRPSSAWALGSERDGVAVAKPKGTAPLLVPLTAKQAQAEFLLLRVHTARSSSVTVRVNGAASGGRGHGTMPLAGGWQTVQVPVAADQLHAGENELSVRFRHNDAVVAWVQVGGDELAGDPLPLGTDAELVVRRGDGLVYYLQVPDSAQLSVELRGDGCEVAAVVQASAGARVDARLSPGTPVLDLASLGGQVARVELTAVQCDQLQLAGAAVTVPGSAPSVVRGQPPKYIVLWLMDALRADYLRPFAADAKPEVPTLERLAASGTVYKVAYSQGAESQASHATMWTGQYPEEHRVSRKPSARVPDHPAALGNALQAAGFYNVGISGNGFVTASAGYGHGFDRYINLMAETYGRGRYAGKIPAARFVARTVRELAEHTGNPFFLFLGTIDTHKPWMAYEPWISRYDSPSYRGKFKHKATGGMLGMVPRVRGCVLDPGKREVERIRNIYASDVSYQDQQVGELLAQLETWGIANETMIILTADHGEELWERGRCGHGYSLRNTLVHVPLLIHYPPMFPAGVVSEGAEIIDILPTILDALGQPIPAEIKGESLLARSQGVGAGYPRPAFASMAGGSVTMRLGGWKMQVTRKRGVQLYDLASDPWERTDVAAMHSVETRFVADALGMFLAHQGQWSKSRWGVASNMTAEAARALGRDGS